ncbi:hypothetical protein [Microbacterium gorillae]|uniref:hypothetical protein n=1 Tax=Microbacterium gorillae TaxID=1231063 RepID=UPI003D967B29
MAVAAAPTPNLAPLLAGLAVAAGIGASLLRLPGVAVALIILVIAAWMSTPPQMTGKKDAAGYPTIGNPGEERVMLRHRTWASLRWKLFIPSTDWLLNDPSELRDINDRADKVAAMLPPLKKAVAVVKVVFAGAWLVVPTRFMSFIAIGAALVASTLPVDAFDMWGILPGAGQWLMWPNAIAAYVIVVQIAAARRRFASISDPRPSVNVGDFVAASKKRDRPVLAVLSGAAGIAAVTVTATLVILNALNITWLITPPPLTAAGFALMAAAAFLRGQSLPEAHTDWVNTVEARAAWAPRWQTLKIDPAPFLVSHTRLGHDDQLPVHVDTFDAPATLGSAGALGMLSKIAPTLGAGMRVSILNEPDVDSKGQSIPGSKHLLRFTVVAWPVDTVVDVTDPDADLDMVRMLVRTAAAANTGGWPQPMLLELQPAFARGAARIDASGEEMDGVVSAAAYETIWGAPDVDCTDLMPVVAGGAAGYIGAEVIADKSAGAVMYVGALTNGETVFADPDLGERFEVLAREVAWDGRWTNVLKMGEQKPWIQSAVYKEANLDSGQLIECQPFMTPQGIQSELYITEEKERKLQSTLNNAPFVSVIGWPISGDRPGERHPGAFQVLWSMSPIPANPAMIPPGGRGLSGEAVKWALSASVNRGFDSAKLPRPEITSSMVLTSRQSRQHIWDLTLRLYGGVTLLAVKAAAEKIRQGMGATEWLRITSHPEGARIVVGAPPNAAGIQFARPRNKAVTTALDWEQVFIDAKLVSPVDGSAPRLLDESTLDTNDQVDALVFTIPRGMSITDFQEPKAVDKMRVNASKVFIDVRHTDNADTMRLLVCDVDPMPMPAPFMWDSMGKEPRSSSFGTNVEGAPVTWDLDLDSHLLILGSNGSGKGIAATSLLTDQLMSMWDVYAADPNKGFNDFAFADPWLKYRATTYPDTVAVARKMVELLEERKQLNSKYGVSNVKDLPEEVRPRITCMYMDEFTSLIIPEVVPKLGENPTEQDLREHAEVLAINAAKATIGGALGRILREGRATGLVMVLMGQKLTADILKYVPGGSTLKSQMSRLAMGKMNFGDMMSAFNDAAGAMGLLGPAVPRGRGIFESTAQAAFAVQTWWGGGSQTEHFQAMVDHIAAKRTPLTDDERLDPAPYRPAVIDTTPVFGRRIDDEDDDMLDVGIVDLGEIDLGLAEGITFDDFDFDDVDAAGVAAVETAHGDDGLTIRAVEEIVGAVPDVHEPDSRAHRVTFVGPGVSSDDPTTVDVDELSAGPVVTGSLAVDAILAWVAARPHIHAVRWESPLVEVLDDIGLTHGELAEFALREAGVIEVELVVGLSASVEPPTQSAPSHAPVTALAIEHPAADAPSAPQDEHSLPTPPPKTSPSFAIDDLFDSPATPAPVRVTDDLFD